MSEKQVGCELAEEDLTAALHELKVYVDVTEADLARIYALALKHARERVALRTPVRAAMATPVVSATADMSLDEAARLLSEHSISALPVVGAAGRVIGIVTKGDLLHAAGLDEGHTFWDILRHVIGERRVATGNHETVGDTMSAPAVTLAPEADLAEAARAKRERGIKRLPVVDEAGKLLGIISRADIVRAVGER